MTARFRFVACEVESPRQPAGFKSRADERTLRQAILPILRSEGNTIDPPTIVMRGSTLDEPGRNEDYMSSTGSPAGPPGVDRARATMSSMVHPLPWRSSIEPASLGSLEVVLRGARSAGSVGDAVVLPDADEQVRRRNVGLGAVCSLPLLDALMCLPVGEQVRLSDLSPHVHRQVMSAPLGVVEVRRRVGDASADAAADGRCGGGASGQVAACFASGRSVRSVHAATDRARSSPASQSDMGGRIAGVGVWALVDGQTHEVCRPAAVRPPVLESGRVALRRAGLRCDPHFHAPAGRVSRSLGSSSSHRRRSVISALMLLPVRRP